MVPAMDGAALPSGPPGAAARLIEAVASRAGVAAVLGRPPQHLSMVAASAHAFVAACIARHHHGKRLWVVCQDLRHQERVQGELETWGVSSHFLPEEEKLPVADALGDPEIAAERLHAFHALADPGDRRPVVLAARSLTEQVPVPEAMRAAVCTVAQGDTITLESVRDTLGAAGYEGQPVVAARGQFAVRGGILDVFPWQASQPVRIEFFGDAVESIREFEIHEQTSTARIPRADILLTPEPSADRISLREWIRPDDLVVSLGHPLADAHFLIDDSIEAGGCDALACAANPAGTFETGDFLLSEAKHAHFVREVRRWIDQQWTVAVLCPNDGDSERFRRLLEADTDVRDAVRIHRGPLAFGFTCPAAQLAVLSSSELFGQFQVHRLRRRFNREAAQQRIRHALDVQTLEAGDPVVHAEYGIARFHGLATEETQGGRREVLVLEFAAKARLFVPIDQAHLVSRYVGIGNKPPALSKLGDARWAKVRKRAEKEILDYAGQLLAVQAERQTRAGHAHPPDTRWQWEFENSFPYRETPDQITSIQQVKADMESPRPMDRLLCGDVGFGKTEVALRAAFKAVMGGKQVAVLVPTTVLAQQHFDTFRQRLSGYPVRVEMLCRLQSPAEQRVVTDGLADGSVDLVVGTHRLISSDIRFRNLGLVVVDEEQRFGVMHKERFKDLFRVVDVLTLSATPIPRTLYLSLVGLREMSTIETPPPSRLPVQTTVCPFDERLVRTAIEQELARGGQVFYLHNRVRTIEHVKQRLETLVPAARVLVGHGQMERHQLEDVMHAFVRGGADVLVATTIIESGIDIPNANTILIDRADRFGMADLYQLRGRVGRSEHKAYAYLLLPRGLMATGDARKRLGAMKEYAALGSGFRVAMRDLEIRGAGSLLGTQQSGHIANIGFDLYCQLLRQSVARLAGTPHDKPIDVVLHTDFLAFSQSEWVAYPTHLPAFLPADHIADATQRVLAYRNLAECTTANDLRALERTWRDRFGPAPEPVAHLVAATALKIAAAHARVSVVEIRGDTLRLTRNGQLIMVEGRFPRLRATTHAERLREALDRVRSL